MYHKSFLIGSKKVKKKNNAIIKGNPPHTCLVKMTDYIKLINFKGLTISFVLDIMYCVVANTNTK